MRIRDIARARVSYGCRRIHVLLQEGWKVNHKRVYRLYGLEGLTMGPKISRRHVSARRRMARATVSYANESWSMDFIRPGRPTDNALIESFNGRFREECLTESWFLSLEDAGEKVEACRQFYNRERPHGSLGNVPPLEFAGVKVAK